MAKSHARKYFLLLLLTVILASLAFLVKYVKHKDNDVPFQKDTLRCAICLGDFDKLSKGYLTGYNFELLRNFAESIGIPAEIDIHPDAAPYVDSIRQDVLDILVVPRGSFQMLEGVTETHSGDSTISWIVKASQARVKEVDKWFQTFQASENFIPTRDRFFNGYNPYRRQKTRTDIISPYDGLLRVHSKTIGWDWKLVAAIMWQESRFRIQAKSGRGAVGLLQMMPRTADKYDVENRFDPEESIRAGSAYLARLNKMFRNYASDDSELTKFTLAAFNSGEGRILNCISEADSLGVGHAVWDSVKTVPSMSAETVGFVRSVLGKYQEFLTY